MTTNAITQAAVSALAMLIALTAAQAEPQRFDSPDAAASAVISAIEARDPAALLAVFGPEFKDVVFSGDDAEDREVWTAFLLGYQEANRIDMVAEDRAVLHIGREDWPFPAPVLLKDGTWAFDGESAREEVRLRRIGLNELDVIELLRAGVAVQQRYRQTDHDGDGVMEFASSILSTAGQRDGLYWPDEPGTEPSPIGELMARAAADGYNMGTGDSPPDPYLGYYFRILQSQGPDAPGGEMEYRVGGNMVAGHAILAYPAEYGVTGVMSFMVGENGVVYEADLGPDTLDRGNAITGFNPGEGWQAVD